MTGSEAAFGTAPRAAIVVMGVSASGKSVVGAGLALTLGCDFVDGDDLHPPANVAKMKAGTPLTDEDRAPWLDRVGAEIGDRDRHPRGVVVACSALRRPYRDRIRAAAGPELLFVFLDIPIAEARRRIEARHNHFMPPSLIDSQYATLERPVDEPDVVAIDRLADIEPTTRAAVEAVERRKPDLSVRRPDRPA